jgi:predicted MPP superfamily phosphohydrolase
MGCLWVSAFLWARLIEPLWIETHEQRLVLPALNAPMRVVVFSDTHSDSRFDVDDRLAERINRLEPDVIIFLGDALSTGDRAPNFRTALTAMRARHAKLAIRGNWDVWYWGDVDLFGGTGFQELHNGWHLIAAGSNRLRVSGHAFVDPWAPNEVVPPPPAGDGPAILLYHANDYVHRAAEVGVDLYLCGDTHGGQLAIPLWGALFSVGRQGRDFVRGLYRVGKMQAYVTRGIGVEHGFPYRFGVRPEITVLDLRPE